MIQMRGGLRRKRTAYVSAVAGRAGRSAAARGYWQLTSDSATLSEPPALFWSTDPTELPAGTGRTRKGSVGLSSGLLSITGPLRASTRQ